MKICEVCGRSFEAKRSDAKYCSKKCRQNKSVRAKRNSFSIKVCEICGKEFKGPNNQKYCSDNCKDWALELNSFRGHEDRYDYLDSVTIGDEEDFID